MAQTHKLHNHNYHEFPTLSFSKHQQNSINQSLLHSPSDHAFPLLAIAALSILATVLLLVAYYVIVNKCCINHHHFNPFRWFNIFRRRRNDDSFIALSPSIWTRGLDESVIRSIPTFQYRTGESNYKDRSIKHCCVVCLNEFQEQDMLRILPNCNHTFHLDCIDIWFQSNDNCPLCRNSISGNSSKFPINHIIAPSSSPQNSQQYVESVTGSDEDFVVIELGGEDEEAALERRNHELPVIKMDRKRSKSKPRKCHHVSIMGDECIGFRGKDDQFSIQPMRRSFSWDSAVDTQLYFSVQAIIQQNSVSNEVLSIKEGSSNQIPRSFLSLDNKHQKFFARNLPC